MDTETTNPADTLTPLAAYLTAKMEELGIKPAELARRSGLTKQALGQILAGRIRKPSSEAVCKLRRGLADPSYDAIMSAVCETLFEKAA